MRRIVWTAVVVSVGGALASLLGSRAAEPAANQYTNSLKMKLVRIEPGEFLMGQGDAPRSRVRTGSPATVTKRRPTKSRSRNRSTSA